MPRFFSSIAALVLGFWSLTCAAQSSEPPVGGAQKDEAPLQLGELDAEARPSIDALVDDFITAISAKDMQALTRLRVSEKEYLDIIVPGGVPVGEPPRRNTPKVKDFFWKMLNDKSYTYAEQFLKEFGGRSYTRTQVDFTKPTAHFAWYDAYGGLRLQMADEDGNIWKLKSGSIVEVRGKYKFVGYQYD